MGKKTNWSKVRDANGNKKFCTVNVRINDVGVVLKLLGIDRDGAVQTYYTDLVMQNFPDFMPQESGQLVAGVHKASNCRVRVDGPYARFLFFGLKKDGTPIDYRNANPNGGAHWDRRMAQSRGARIARDVALYAKGLK